MKTIIVIAVCLLYLAASDVTEAANDTHSSNITEIFVKLAKLIPENVDAEDLKKKIEEAFGNESEPDDKLINLVEDEVQNNKNTTEAVKKWSFHYMWERTTQYLSDLKIDLKKKYKKFANYLRNKFSKSDSKKGQSELWNLEQTAKELTEERINQLKEIGQNGTTKSPDVKKSFFKDKWDKTKKFVKNTGHVVKDKMSKFGTYVKNKWNKKEPEVETNELHNIKKLAQEFLEDSKNLTKDVAEEGMEFFEDLEKVLEDIRGKLNKTINE